MTQALPFLAPAVALTLDNCDREPIHIPSLIQPHGMLIAARKSDLVTVYVSENSLDFLGIEPAHLLGQTIASLLGLEALAEVEAALGKSDYLPNNILPLHSLANIPVELSVVAHRTGEMLCLEFERVVDSRQSSSSTTRMEEAIRQLGRARSIEDLYSVIPPMIRDMTGYDRVMVYRFDEEGHGQVVAEATSPGMDPFLGLRYPATDIPVQARKLYILQRVRQLVDVSYRPVPIAVHHDHIDGPPLDMTYSSLRSVSPLHIEYLRNMGVQATFAISLVHEDALWGMVICHHRKPKQLSPAVRSFGDLFGQVASLLIGTTQYAQQSADRLAKKLLLDLLRSSVQRGSSIAATLEEQSQAVLELADADGLFFQQGDQTALIGRTLELVAAGEFLSILRATHDEGTLTSTSVSESHPAFASHASLMSGFMMIPFSEPGDGMLWMRGEVVQTIRWAGDPSNPKEVSEEQPYRLSPRKSFAEWVSMKEGRSLPWSPATTSAAVAFSRLLAEQHLLDKLRQEQMLRQKRIEALSHMAGGLAHEINNPLAIIHGTASDLQALTDNDAPVVASEVRRASNIIVQTSNRAMKILRGLRGFAREGAQDPLELASIVDIAEHSFDPQQGRFEKQHVDLRLVIQPDIPLFLCREVQIEQIITNLLNNAFDAITQHDCLERWVAIDASCNDGYLFLDVIDSGPGLEKDAAAHLMEPFFTTKNKSLGMGIGLSLSQAIATEHGGSLIFCKDEEHTCFRLTLPIPRPLEKQPGSQLVQS